MIVLETALPIKFADTIVEALGHQPGAACKFAGIEDLPKRVVVAGQCRSDQDHHIAKIANKVPALLN